MQQKTKKKEIECKQRDFKKYSKISIGKKNESEK